LQRYFDHLLRGLIFLVNQEPILLRLPRINLPTNPTCSRFFSFPLNNLLLRTAKISHLIMEKGNTESKSKGRQDAEDDATPNPSRDRAESETRGEKGSAAQSEEQEEEEEDYDNDDEALGGEVSSQQ
jgi:hypothetical protein